MRTGAGVTGDGLHRVLAELRLPHPDRARFAREMSADLVALTRELQARGWGLDEARRRAEEMLLPGGAALAALERLHRPLYGDLTAGVSPARMRRWERVVFAVLSTLAVAATLVGLTRADLLASPSPFLVPVLALGVAAVMAAVAKAFQLFVKRDHAAEGLRRGLGGVLILAAVTPVAGAAGFLVDFYTLAAVMEAGPTDPGGVVLTFFARASALLASSLVLALLAGLLWFLLLQWIAGVEHAERELGEWAADPDLPSQEIVP